MSASYEELVRALQPFADAAEFYTPAERLTHAGKQAPPYQRVTISDFDEAWRVLQGLPRVFENAKRGRAGQSRRPVADADVPVEQKLRIICDFFFDLAPDEAYRWYWDEIANAEAASQELDGEAEVKNALARGIAMAVQKLVMAKLAPGFRPIEEVLLGVGVPPERDP